MTKPRLIAHGMFLGRTSIIKTTYIRMATGHEKHKNRKTQSGKKSSSLSGRDAKASTVSGATPRVPLKLQQQCLDIFRDAFSPCADDVGTLQEVKGHLYNRDFAAAFGKDAYLRVYASRWSPSRALAYLDVLKDVQSHLELRQRDDEAADVSILCLGGGAGGELVAIGGWLNSMSNEAPDANTLHLDLALVDIADWTNVVDDLCSGLTTLPKLSKYASQAKKDANASLIDASEMVVSFVKMDVLETDAEAIERMNGLIAKADLITFMFTLNELYSTSMNKTQDLLSRITGATRCGTLLLVVDSPGSYSTISLNGAEKQYPMQWLLDYTLLGSPKKETSSPAGVKWEKLMDDTSKWFRLPADLEYPIELENMRYQIHLYRRRDDEK